MKTSKNRNIFIAICVDACSRFPMFLLCNFSVLTYFNQYSRKVNNIKQFWEDLNIFMVFIFPLGKHQSS